MEKVININSKPNKPKPHNRRNAQEIIQSIAKNGNNVSYSKHAIERMDRGFTYNDMLTILREGIIREEPRYSEDKHCWAYKMEFIKFDGLNDAACVVAIRKKGKLHIITVMWINC